jgi:hypothetical protein
VELGRLFPAVTVTFVKSFAPPDRAVALDATTRATTARPTAPADASTQRWVRCCGWKSDSERDRRQGVAEVIDQVGEPRDRTRERSGKSPIDDETLPSRARSSKTGTRVVERVRRER